MTTVNVEAKLNEIVNRGMANAGPVIERVLKEVPTDRIVRAKGIAESLIVQDDGALQIGTIESGALHDNARGQLMARVGIPASYASELGIPDRKSRYADTRGENAWKRNLLQHNLREHLAHSDERFLVRSQGGQIRGIMSDRYRRLDTRPLLDAFIGTCNEIGAVPYEGLASDLSTSVRAIVPRVIEPIPGEYMVLGLSWQNSDYGARAYGISAFAIRLVCLNGLVGESALKQVHLGGRLPDNLELSAETYRRDTETMISATRDIVRGLLAPAAIERRNEAVRKAAALEVDIVKTLKGMKELNKGESQEVRKAFESPDTVMLPPGQNAWRLSNALSWVAHQAQPERRLELQALAGRVVA